MSPTLAHVLVAAAVMAAMVIPASSAAQGSSGDGKLRADLQQVLQRTVFFGHQSVGENLIEGLQRLASAEGQPLRVVRIADGAVTEPRTFAHALVPSNGHPLLKLQSFERALAVQRGVDVALVKFCYVDIDADTEVRPLFQAYQETLARLEARYPNTTFVRVTVPLQTVQRGPRAVLKKMLGRNTGLAANARREEFNDLVRQAAQGKAPLFDLAHVESTRPDGQVEAASWDGRPVRALVAAYTSDGGHLNASGQDRAARELAAVIAAAPLRRR